LATPIAPFVLAPLALLMLYRRVRRSVGRQLLRPHALMVRVVIMALIALGLGSMAWFAPQLGLGAVAGLVLGAGLGLIGLKLTRFESDAEHRYYIPNPYIGVALSALLLARLAYRYMVLVPSTVQAASASAMPPPYGSPLTMALVALLIGYYLSYSAGVLLRSRAPATFAAV
jgi:hypothetical protein